MLNVTAVTDLNPAQSAFYRLRGLFFHTDGGPAGHLQAQVRITLDRSQNLARHTVVNLAGMSGFDWIADYDFQGSLGKVQTAFGSKCSNGRIQRALHVVPLRF